MKLELLWDFIYPSRCPICDSVVDAQSGTQICKACMGGLPIIRGHRCAKCGRALKDKVAEYCQDCKAFGVSHIFDKGYALFTYDDSVRESIYRFKYGGRSAYAKVYGKLLSDAYASAFKKVGADSVVAVPLHIKRKRDRGYNQAELVAKEFAKNANILFIKDAVVREKSTKPLKTMTRSERQNNLKKAFKIGRNDVKLNITIVIDDIYTTGSTIDAVSEILRESGATKIYFLVIAIGEDR